MSDEQTWKGWWWPADEPDEWMAGNLRFHPRSGAELHLFGQREEPQQNRWPQIPAIHGRSVQGGPLTLLDPLLRRDTWHMGSFGCEEHWAATTLVVGEHVHSSDLFTFTDSRAQLRGLEDLLRRGLHQPGASLEDRTAVARRGPVNVTLEFVKHERRSQMQQASEFRPRLRLDSSEPVPLDQGRAAIRAIESLIVLATGKQSWLQELVSVVERPVEPMLRVGDVKTLRERIEVLSQRLYAGERRGRSHGRDLLPRGSLSDHVLQRWMDLHVRLEPPIFYLFGELNRDRPVLENRIVSLTSYTEAYHGRLHASEGNLRDRIRSLVDRARPAVPPLGPFADRLADEIVDSRTQIIHDKRRPATLEGLELANALDRLVATLLANLLMDVGLPPEVLAERFCEAYAAHTAFSTTG